MKGDDEFPLQLGDYPDSNNYVNLICNVRFVDYRIIFILQSASTKVQD